ncbi:MAG: Ig-like domain-containing protein [Bacteroidaceae bacterium]|nr:Ig-like domain-containing protein [Bacteroidaceae bacterium]
MKTKNFLMLLLLLFVGLQTTWAQKVVLHLTGNQAVEYDISQLDSISFIEGTTEEHEWVDLGLPSGTLWATCNVGANSPEEYGDYFAWGETEPKNDYSWSTYKYCKGTNDTMTKYCTISDYGTVDNKTELEPSDDAATANWGSEWQMPSLEQCKELYNNNYTTTTWTVMNGIYGRMIVSNSNGNSVFLPAAGWQADAIIDGTGGYGYYWSRSLYTTSGCDHALYLDFASQYIDWASGYRYYGRTIRPVRVKNVQTVEVTSITLNLTELSVKVGETTQLSATVLPENASNKDIKWESSNADVATVDETGKVVAVAVGTCTIICSATDGSRVNAKCLVTVLNGNSGTLDGHVYVDLGLPSGTLWATCNVGANSPEEYGDYFAWGETEPKNDYSWSTYKYCKGSDDTMTKYCTSSSYGTVDNKTELEAIDDAATANWGSDWQMPNYEQFKELYNNNYTTTTWTRMNGKYGCEITSKSNGNSIFLPAAGYSIDTSLNKADSFGNYWSRSLSTDASRFARYLSNYAGYISTSIYYRYYGQSVRPVRVVKK